MRLLKGIALLLIVLVLAFAGFFVWASSGTLAEDELAALTVYDDGAVRRAAPHDTFTVMTYNLGYLSATTNNRPVKTTAAFFAETMETAVALIRRVDPDVIAFQEIDFGAGRSYDVHQLDTLAARGGYAASATAVNWDERYVPFPSANPLMHFGHVLSGQAVLSRYRLSQHERLVLERPERVMSYPPPLNRLAEAFYIDRLAQVVAVDLGQPVLLINVHLEAWDAATRQRQARQVRALVERYRDDHAVVLLGDFNIVSPEHRTMEALEAQGFQIPENLKKEKTNLKGDKHYDQIALKVEDKRLEIGESGVFDFRRLVFRAQDFDSYFDKMPAGKRDFHFKGPKNGQPRTDEEKLDYYLEEWRTWQISDHMPMWVELKTDFSEDYLEALKV